jgi:carboxyl-terminal processing protease
VASLVYGGPAEKSGLKVDDRILAINAQGDADLQDVSGMAIEDVVGMLRGKRGTSVRLLVMSEGGKPRDVVMARDAVGVAEGYAKSEILTVAGRRIGVLSSQSFYADFLARQAGDKDYRSLSRDLRRMIGELGPVDGIVLDLRGNGGGSLAEAVDVAGLFLGRAPVVQIREAGNRVSIEKASEEAAWRGPLVVLVDSRSAAASEIVAAALQDHGRARIVGDRTYGRGTIQNLLDLDRMPASDGRRFGMLKITLAEFFRPDGRGINGDGVMPDVPFVMGPRVADEPRRASGRIPAVEGVRKPRDAAPPAATRPLPAASATDADPALREAASLAAQASA